MFTSCMHNYQPCHLAPSTSNSISFPANPPPPPPASAAGVPAPPLPPPPPPPSLTGASHSNLKRVNWEKLNQTEGTIWGEVCVCVCIYVCVRIGVCVLYTSALINW